MTTTELMEVYMYSNKYSYLKTDPVEHLYSRRIKVKDQHFSLIDE